MLRILMPGVIFAGTATGFSLPAFPACLMEDTLESAFVPAVPGTFFSSLIASPSGDVL
jgi:hypothetical protein